MSLERISISNFQSLKNIDIELGKFTVITGASSSGKSALLRALVGLSSGLRGNSFITVGAKSCSITAYTDKHIVTLTKSKTKAKYVVTDRQTGKEEPFTKLQASIPPEVSEALRLDPASKDSPSINFAGQHDMPFLLKDSPSQVAKILGDLTNVSTIFEAVRNANKKKLSVGSLLRTRQEDLDSLLGQVAQFQGLASRKSAVEAAERALEALKELEGVRISLERLLVSLEVSEGRLSGSGDLPEVPSLEKLEGLQEDYRNFRQILLSWVHAVQQRDKFTQDFERFEYEEKSAHQAVHDRLSELGTCPTCGKEVT